MNFSEIFRKDATYNNIKVRENHGFTLFLEDTVSEKPQGVKFFGNSWDNSYIQVYY